MGQAASIAAGVVQSVGQLAQGAGEATAYQYNSAVQRQQAGMALQQSYIKAGQTETQVARRAGQAAAAYAAAGVAPASGSALYVMNDIAREGEMARVLQLYQGKVEQLTHRQQADVEHEQATQARMGSYFKAGGTLLSSLGSASASSFTPSGGGGGGGDISDLMSMYASG